MKQFILIALSASLLFNACTETKKPGLVLNGQQEFADSAMSSVRVYKDQAGKQVVQKNNTLYDIIDFIDRNDVKKLLIKNTKIETQSVESNQTEGIFKISVADITAAKTLWSKEIEAADIDYTPKVLLAHKEPKGNTEEDTYTLYSLLNGNALMTYTYSPLSALIPNTSHKRFIGYLSQLSGGEKPKDLAVVSYVGCDALIDKINIKLKNKIEFPQYTPEIKMMVGQESGNTAANEGKTVILSHADRGFRPLDISGFAVEIIYNMPEGKEAITILLPIRNDHIDLNSATYDRALFELTKVD